MKKTLKGLFVLMIVGLFLTTVSAKPINSNSHVVNTAKPAHRSIITLYVETLPMGWNAWDKYAMTGGDQANRVWLKITDYGAQLKYRVRSNTVYGYSLWGEYVLTTMGY